jgi:hypothetical protein
LTQTPAQAKKRIKGFFTGATTVSGVIALANPRRIKASHRRRRRVASDHLLYILNNPLAGTDPTGYRSICGDGNQEHCAIYSPNEDATKKSEATGAKGNSDNGANSGSTVTPANRNQGDAQSSIERFGAPVLRAVLPAVDDYLRKGEPGGVGDHAYNAVAAILNMSLDGLFFMPGMQRISMDIPRMEYDSKGVATAAAIQAGGFFVGGGRTAAGRVGGLADDAARVVGKLADDAAPIIEEIVVTPLRASIRRTFQDGQATRVLLEQPLTVTRFHGGRSGKIGRFATADNFNSRVDAREQLAVLQEWGNAFTKKTTVELPAGTEIWVGRSAPQTGKNGTVLPGGGSQIFIDGQLNKTWFKGTEWFRSYKGNN